MCLKATTFVALNFVCFARDKVRFSGICWLGLGDVNELAVTAIFTDIPLIPEAEFSLLWRYAIGFEVVRSKIFVAFCNSMIGGKAIHAFPFFAIWVTSCPVGSKCKFISFQVVFLLHNVRKRERISLFASFRTSSG